MKHASFRFYAGLNDFLPPPRQQNSFSYAFWGRPAVKDPIEAIGVPHPEVHLIIVNGEPVDFTYPLDDGDRVSVYPRFTSLPVDADQSVHPGPPETHRFILDTHLGRLARYLRMMGLDVVHSDEDPGDAALARRARDENRILLTRDAGLLRRGSIDRGYFVRATNPERQLAEVIHRFPVRDQLAPFSRCMACNTLLEAAVPAAVRDRVPPQVAEEYDRFKVCPSCEKVFWEGSHVQRMQRLIDRVLH